MRTGIALLTLLLLASCRGDTGGPDAQQIARINKELAFVSERINTLILRVDALESRMAASPVPAPVREPGDAPVVDGADSADPTPRVLVVSIGRGYAIDGKDLTTDALAERLRAHAKLGPGAALQIHTDASSSHVRVMKVIDLARQAGIDQFSLTSEKLDATTPSTPSP